MDKYEERYFPALYGTEKDEDGNFWYNVYFYEWESMCDDFADYMVFCRTMKYKPSLNDFTYYLVYLEYAHIGNYSHMEGFEHLSNAFLDLALEIYSQLSHL